VNFIEEGIIDQTIGPDGSHLPLLALFFFILFGNPSSHPRVPDAGQRPHGQPGDHGAGGVGHVHLCRHEGAGR
jgi:hypothetical protein